MMSQNPYASPAETSGPVGPNLPAEIVPKVEAIIKDAGQFWLAILLCFLCTGIGMLIVGPWYLVRLFQWSSIGKRYPQLMAMDVPPGSLEQRFQSSQWKLIVGLVFGVLIALLMVGLLLPALFIAREAAPQGPGN